MKKYLFGIVGLFAFVSCVAFAIDTIAPPANIYDGDAVANRVTVLEASVVVLQATAGTNSPTAAITVGSLTTTGTVTISEGQLANSTILTSDIKDGEIVNADLSASAAIALSKIATNSLGAVTLTFSSSLCTNVLAFNAQGVLTNYTANP